MGHSFAALQNACGQSQRAGKLGRVCEQEPARNCKGLSHAAVSAHSHAHCHVTTEIPKTQIRKLRSIRLARTGWKGWKGRHRRPAASFLQPCPTSLHIGETVTGTWQTLMSDTTFALSITHVRKIEGTPCQVLVTCFLRCSYLPFALASLKSACPQRVAKGRMRLMTCKPYRAGLLSSACSFAVPSMHDMEFQRSLVQEARSSDQTGSKRACADRHLGKGAACEP